MGKQRSRGRVGKVVGRHVNSLYRRNRAAVGAGDALLQRAEFLRQRRLVTDSGRHASEQRRNFRTGLYVTEYIVNKQQDVLVLLVTEIFRERKPRVRHAHTASRRLVHLTEHKRSLVDTARFRHFLNHVVTFAASFADAGEYRIAAVFAGDISDKFHYKHGFTYAGAAEQTNLAALYIRRQKVYNLDSGFKLFRAVVLFEKFRRLA